MKYEISEIEKVLGINWNDSKDLLMINLDEFVREDVKEVTKIDILKVMAGFYDPLGWIQSVVIKLKILFQEACKLKIGMDEKVPPELNKTLTEIKNLVKSKSQDVIVTAKSQIL